MYLLYVPKQFCNVCFSIQKLWLFDMDQSVLIQDTDTSDSGTFNGSKWTSSMFSLCLAVIGRRKRSTWAATGEGVKIILLKSPNRERSLMSIITWVSFTWRGFIISTLPPVKCATAKLSLFSSAKHTEMYSSILLVHIQMFNKFSKSCI